MAEAKSTRRRLSSTKERLLARTIQKAVRDREIPNARQMVGHLVRDKTLTVLLTLLFPYLQCPQLAQQY